MAPSTLALTLGGILDLQSIYWIDFCGLLFGKGSLDTLTSILTLQMIHWIN
ncbi:MAG: hypothetical protein AAGE89_15255 [Pseudomonadota bacterium]